MWGAWLAGSMDLVFEVVGLGIGVLGGGKGRFIWELGWGRVARYQSVADARGSFVCGCRNPDG